MPILPPLSLRFDGTAIDSAATEPRSNANLAIPGRLVTFDQAGWGAVNLPRVAQE